MNARMQTVVRWLAALCAIGSLVAAFGAAAQDGARPGDDFLKLMDGKKYAESWDAGSEFLKQSVSRPEWTSQMVRTRDTIGEVASRKLKSSEPQKDPPGAPPGEYLLQTYETVFASQGAPRIETLPLIKAADGKWRAVGYFIR